MDNIHEESKVDRRPWVPPIVKAIGSISEILRQGGGKLSIIGGDPGEGRKQGPAGPT